MPDIGKDAFENIAINEFGTTAYAMLQKAYKYSPSAAVLDLIAHDEELVQVKERNLQPYDFPYAPNNMWITKSGEPTAAARHATKELIQILATRREVD